MVITMNHSKMKPLFLFRVACILATIAIFGYIAVNYVSHDECVPQLVKRYQGRSAFQPLGSAVMIDTSTSTEKQAGREAAWSLPLETSIVNDLHNSFASSKVDKFHPFLRTDNGQSSRRRLPGDIRMDPAEMSGIIIIVIIVLILFCCFRGMLCDILACVCLYEICCDDAAIGGFDLM
jgi:hypothetical protein